MYRDCRLPDFSRCSVPGWPAISVAHAMFDVVTSRIAATRMHAPVVVFGMIAILAVVSAVFVGFGMPANAGRGFVHTFAFATVLSCVIYVIVDLEFPRLGFIRVDDFDRLLTDRRASMG
jgi:hypothetical protein